MRIDTINSLINLIAGILIMALPGWMDFNGVAANNNHIVGPILITIAIVSMSDVSRNALYFNSLSGVWLMMSPFFLDYPSTPALINSILAVVIILSSIQKRHRKKRFGGGWQSLLQQEPDHVKEAKTPINGDPDGD